ncbi:hypothetical protein MHBO_001497 [Bonamia ostreae]|uniref:Protein kinase domain-containing protein n=1 Tax=Bonamia ostreae TaxID=126728 RepID=A0ABV2AJ65_9EUKA
MEFCETDMNKLSSEEDLSVDRIKKYFRMIIQGVEYLHSIGYVHYDLKLDNVLITENDTVRVADFGLSRKIGPPDINKNFEATLIIKPPELIEGGEVGFYFDSWALGCCLVRACSEDYAEYDTSYDKVLKSTTITILKYFVENADQKYVDAFNPILAHKLLVENFDKRLWGKSLPVAADDPELRDCFGLTQKRDEVKSFVLFY